MQWAMIMPLHSRLGNRDPVSKKGRERGREGEREREREINTIQRKCVLTTLTSDKVDFMAKSIIVIKQFFM